MKNINKTFYTGLLIIYVLGTLSHFAYDFINIKLFAIIFPTNESIYEHTKLAIFPLIVFYVYLYIKERDFKRTTLCFLVSLITSVLLIPMIYYLYVNTLGFESTVIDISIFFVSITISQLLALHIYKNVCNINIGVTIVLIITYFIINTIVTYIPPKTPIFYDEVSSKYGI